MKGGCNDVMGYGKCGVQSIWNLTNTEGFKVRIFTVIILSPQKPF